MKMSMLGSRLSQMISTRPSRWTAAFGVALLLMAALLLLASPLRAHSPIGALLPRASFDHTPAQAAEPSGAGEGVQVHGDWLIEVFNPDGTLATQRAFKNALSGGAKYLADILGRRASVGYWWVQLYPSSSIAPPCVRTVGQYTDDVSCSSIEAGSPVSPGSEQAHFPTLKVSTPTTGQDAGKLVLRGSVTAARDSKIGNVNTGNTSCPPGSAPAQPCATGPNAYFTHKALNPEIEVKEGQFVDITVVISFS